MRCRVGILATLIVCWWVYHAAINKEATVLSAKTPGEIAMELKTLSIGDGSDWSFHGGPWSEDQEGAQQESAPVDPYEPMNEPGKDVIRPLDKMNLHSRAFYLGSAYEGPLEAEFEFNGSYRETGTGSAGLIIGAKDLNHFHYVYFPWGGQQLRAKHFWAAIAKVDGDGYTRHLAAEWVPGIASETDRWFHVRVRVENDTITVWVDGRLALSATNVAYEGGCVGLAGYGWYCFRNVRVTSAAVPAPEWDRDATIPSHGIELALPGDKMPSGCIAPNGDVLLAAGTQLLRSQDKGRTWLPPETLPEKLGEITDYASTMYCTRAGRLMVMIYRAQTEGAAKPEILTCESTDNGYTWSDPVPAAVADGWPEHPKTLYAYGPLVENKDGVLMRFLLGGVKTGDEPFTDVRTWSTTHCKALMIRSQDGGASWSAPVEIDRPSWHEMPRSDVPGSLDFTEPTAVVMGDTVMVLIRPIYSQTMWQCWSYDGGATWDAAARTTFPGYAQSMARMASGAILCAHRYPHYAVNVSYDNGLNWDAGTVIDYPVWAMGCIVEVEPDVALCVYMNANREQPLLAQRVHVTPEGLRPATE